MSHRAVHQNQPRRPALVCSLAFASGVVACKTGSLAESFCVLLLAAVVCHLLADVGWSGWVALAVFAGLGAIRFQLSQTVFSPYDLRLHPDSGGNVLFYGRTAGEPDVRPGATHLVFEADSILYPDSLCPREGRVLARFKFDPGIGPGSRVVLSGRLRPPQPAFNPGDFSWSDYFLQRDLCAHFEPARGSPVLRIVPASSGWLSLVVAPLRRAVKTTLSSHLDGEEAALLLGLILGERQELAPETVRAFQRTGTLHLLAVSGSNVGVVVAVVWGVLLFLRVMRPIRIFLAAVAVVLFCFLAHNEASVVRATSAGLLVLGGWALRRRPDALNLWGCALLLLSAWDPRALFGLGFQLSFGATLGILLVAPLVPQGSGGSWWAKLGPLIAAGVIVSLAAQAATLPILAGAFNEVPMVTPLANLVCVPLAGAATSAGVISLLLAPFGDALFEWTSAAAWLCLRLLLLAVKAFDRLGIPVVELPSPAAWGIALYAGLLLGLWAFVCIPRSRRKMAFCSGLVLAIAAAWSGLVTPSGPELLVLRSPALNALLRLPDGSVWLVTGDPAYSSEQASRASRKLGWSAPRGRIDLKASGEKSTSTLREIEGCVGFGDMHSDSSMGLVTIWCRASDSLPAAVVVVSRSAAVVLQCSPIPAWSPEWARYESVTWVTDTRTGLVRRPDAIGRDIFILTGKANRTAGPDSVQVLNTEVAGAIRIFWRDSAFQSEPSIR